MRGSHFFDWNDPRDHADLFRVDIGRRREDCARSREAAGEPGQRRHRRRHHGQAEKGTPRQAEPLLLGGCLTKALCQRLGESRAAVAQHLRVRLRVGLAALFQQDPPGVRVILPAPAPGGPPCARRHPAGGAEQPAAVGGHTNHLAHICYLVARAGCFVPPGWSSAVTMWFPP